MREQSQNDKTIAAYNHEVASYLANTPQEYNNTHKTMLEWIETSLSHVPTHGTILELGSGPGRDAQYIKNRGYEILCSDAARSFVDHLNKNGQHAILYNILKDELDQQYNMIFANAVFPHFTSGELTLTLKKARRLLRPQGVISFSIKQGNGEKWINEKFNEKRFVHYWKPDDLMALLQSQNYELLFHQEGNPGDLPTHTWTLIIARPL